MTFALLGSFSRGNYWWFSINHRDHAFTLGPRDVLDAWLAARSGRPERVRRGRCWAIVTPDQPEQK